MLRAELEEEGFDCDECEQDPTLKSYRGCGVPPQVEIDYEDEATRERSSKTIAFTLEFWHSECARLDLDEDQDSAAMYYHDAGFGGFFKLTGSPWPCCPRFYEAKASFVARRSADRARKLRHWREAGSLEAVATLPLVPWVADLVDLAHALVEQKRAEAMKPKKEA